MAARRPGYPAPLGNAGQETSCRTQLLAQTPPSPPSAHPQRSSSLVNLQAHVNAPPSVSEARLRTPSPAQPSDLLHGQSSASQTVDHPSGPYDGGTRVHQDRLSPERQTMTGRNPGNQYLARSYPSYYDRSTPPPGQQQYQGASTQRHAQAYPQPEAYAYGYPSNPVHRPLIDLVTNEWQNKTKYSDHYSDYSDDDYAYAAPEKDIWPTWMVSLSRIRVPRRVQRGLLLYLLFLLCCWFVWLYWLQPAWEEEKILDESLTRAAVKGNSFGSNIRPAFTDMVHLQHLDSRLVPGSSNEKRRLVFVGDVHGCKDELLGLLDSVSFDNATDHLIFTGDLIAKGPDSPGVVEIARRYGASCVRGNHEDRVLLAWSSMRSRGSPSLPGPDEDPQRKDDDMGEESFNHGDYRERALAASFSAAQLRWLKACPVILRVGRIPGLMSTFGGAAGSGSNGDGEVVVAHAGLIPGVDLERQDPFQAMNMRSIDLDTRVPSELRAAGEPWEKIWNHHMNHLHPPSQRVTVVYGHDAKRGLNVQRYSKGLDSNCVRGGSLTALVIDWRGRQKVFSVKCKGAK